MVTTPNRILQLHLPSCHRLFWLARRRVGGLQSPIAYRSFVLHQQRRLDLKLDWRRRFAKGGLKLCH